MSRQPIARSPDLKKLQDEGFELEIRSTFLLVNNLPYVTQSGTVKRGTLVCKLDLAGDVTVRPEDHVAHFIGEYPCTADGDQIAQIRSHTGRREIGPGVFVDHTFSAKPLCGYYANYYDKVTTYAAILSGPAQRIDPSATGRTFAPIRTEEDEPTVFKYLDTASSRAEIGSITKKLEVDRLAIVGLGGTGGYVLDLVAKTPPREIHLFDGDRFLQHNAFRAPGAASIEDLEARLSKVAYFSALYSKMRHGIIPHEEYVGPENLHLLSSMNFVFLCMEGGPGKKLIVDYLVNVGVAFVDVGLGIQLSDGALGGLLRVTTGTSSVHDHLGTKISFADDDTGHDYDRNIQVADLNALNATLAVIRWKKHCGFYRDAEGEHHALYAIDGNSIENSELHLCTQN